VIEDAQEVGELAVYVAHHDCRRIHFDERALSLERFGGLLAELEQLLDGDLKIIIYGEGMNKFGIKY